MGEIATWSAVKTKVGLGKDSNECPTKAELLALSPTGTGENYIAWKYPMPVPMETMKPYNFLIFIR